VCFVCLVFLACVYLVGCVVCSKEGRKEREAQGRLESFECGFGKEGEAQGRFGSFECGFGEMKGKQVYNGWISSHTSAWRQWVGGGVQLPTVLSSDMLSVISEIEVSTLLRNGNVVAVAATVFFFFLQINASFFFFTRILYCLCFRSCSFFSWWVLLLCLLSVSISLFSFGYWGLSCGSLLRMLKLLPFQQYWRTHERTKHFLTVLWTGLLSS
jgi:hypothetical protein